MHFTRHLNSTLMFWFFLYYCRLTFLLNIVDLVSEIEDIVRRVEVILIQQPGLTANLIDIQHQIRVLQVQDHLVCFVIR